MSSFSSFLDEMKYKSPFEINACYFDESVTVTPRTFRNGLNIVKNYYSIITINLLQFISIYFFLQNMLLR
jgi:hypothetical protein